MNKYYFTEIVKHCNNIGEAIDKADIPQKDNACYKITVVKTALATYRVSYFFLKEVKQ